MLTNTPNSIVSRFNIDQLTTIRPLYIEEFSDGSGFVFNSQDPGGVKYLTKDAFGAYSALINEYGRPPIVDPMGSLLFSDLVKHGIANSVEPPIFQPKSAKKEFTVWFHISNACNLSCAYCYIPKLSKAIDVKLMNGHFMNASTIEEATKSLFQFCSEQLFTHLQIKFAGGEPTLNPGGIGECCVLANKYSREYKVAVSFGLLTNGVFIDNEIFEIIKKYRISVSISMDGDKTEHDRVRFTARRSRLYDLSTENNIQGSWDIIDNNIDALLSRGISPFILTTVTAVNYKQLFGLVKFAISKRVGLRFSLVRDKNSYKKEHLQQEILLELAKIYEWLGENMPSDMPIDRYAKFAEWDLAIKKQAVCGTCKSTMAIDQQGNVASCQMRLHKPSGNLKTEPLTTIFDKIMNTEDNRYLKSPQEKSGDCSVCYWKYTCAGGCPEHTRLAFGTANSPSPWCSVYQGLLPHYLRAIAKQIKNAVRV